MKPDVLIRRIDDAVPGFGGYCESDKCAFAASSVHGVFAACSHFVRDHSVSADGWRQLAAIVNEAVESSDSELENAVSTCFLENLASKHHPLALEQARFNPRYELK